MGEVCFLSHPADSAFMQWAKHANACFYHLHEFSQLGEEIRHADALIARHGMPEHDPVRSRFVAAYFNALIFCQPDARAVAPWYERAMLAYEQLDQGSDRIVLHNHLMLYDIWIGRMAHARMLYRDFLGYADGSITNPLIRMMHYTMCAQLEWLDMEIKQCLSYVEEGLAFAARAGVDTWNAQLAAQAVYALISAGRLPEAAQWLARLETYKNPERSLDHAQYHYLRAWLALSQRESKEACIHAGQALKLTQKATVPFAVAATRILLAQALYQEGKLVRAGAHIAKAAATGRLMRSNHIRFATLLAATQLAKDQDRENASVRHLRHALRLGQGQGYWNIPGWPHQVMSCLFEMALRHEIEPEYVGRLIRLHRAQPADAATPPVAWSWPVEASCFGRLGLRVDGRNAVNGRNRNRLYAMLRFLLIHPQGASNQMICDALWPEAEGDKAVRALHVTQHRLRELLEHRDALQVDHGMSCLNGEVVHNDFQQCQQLLDRLESCGRQRHDKLIGTLMGVYRGMLFEDAMDAPWLISVREQTHLRVLHGLGRQLSALISDAETDQTEMFALQMLAIDPLAETICLQLLSLYQQQREHIKMRRVYDEYTHILRDRYGETPSSRFKAFFPSM